VRSGTNEVENTEEETNLSEKLINDIVAMDAAFDPNQLPDLSVGIKPPRQFFFMLIVK